MSRSYVRQIRKINSDLTPEKIYERSWALAVLEQVGRRLQEELAGLFSPVRLHLLLLEEENAHVQHAAAIKGLPVYVVNEEFARQYRRKVYALYADWHSWW